MSRQFPSVIYAEYIGGAYSVGQPGIDPSGIRADYVISENLEFDIGRLLAEVEAAKGEG